MKINLIDEIITEIADKKVFGRIKYLVVNKETFEEIKSEFEYEFGSEYFDQGREPNKNDIEEYFKLKIIIDDKEARIKGDKKYLLLTADRTNNKPTS